MVQTCKVLGTQALKAHIRSLEAQLADKGGPTDSQATQTSHGTKPRPHGVDAPLLKVFMYVAV